jgi:hypothetical protein
MFSLTFETTSVKSQERAGADSDSKYMLNITPSYGDITLSVFILE